MEFLRLYIEAPRPIYPSEDLINDKLFSKELFTGTGVIDTRGNWTEIEAKDKFFVPFHGTDKDQVFPFIQNDLKVYIRNVPGDGYCGYYSLMRVLLNYKFNVSIPWTSTTGEKEAAKRFRNKVQDPINFPKLIKEQKNINLCDTDISFILNKFQKTLDNNTWVFIVDTENDTRNKYQPLKLFYRNSLLKPDYILFLFHEPGHFQQLAIEVNGKLYTMMTADMFQKEVWNNKELIGNYPDGPNS